MLKNIFSEANRSIVFSKSFLKNSYRTSNQFSSTEDFNFSCNRQKQLETKTWNPKDPKIIIIGAGLSGLSAAENLIKNNFKNFLILEAAERCGGRIRSESFGDSICELGPKCIACCDAPDSLFSMGLKAGLSENMEAVSINWDGKFCTSSGESLDNDVTSLGREIFNNLIGKTAAGYATICSSNKFKNLKEYFENEVRIILKIIPPEDRKDINIVLRTMLRSLENSFGCDFSCVNPKQLGLKAECFLKPVYVHHGMEQILKKVIEEIPKKNFLLGKPVCKIIWANLGDEETQAEILCADGSKYFADHIICTLPLGVLKTFSRNIFSPQLPLSKFNAISVLGVASPGRIYLEFTEPVKKWFSSAMKFAWSNKDLEYSRIWTRGISDVTLVPGSEKILEIKVGGGRSNEIVERQPEDKLIKDIREILKKFTKNSSIPRPSGVLRSLWSTDARFLGGIPYLAAHCNELTVKKVMSPLGPLTLSCFPRLLFAGDATCWKGFGTLQAARNSGIREAERIKNFYKTTGLQHQ